MSASVNQIMYPNVKFPTPVLPSHPTASKSLSSSASLPSPLATPLALLPDFRPEQVSAPLDYCFEYSLRLPALTGSAL